MQIVRFLDEQNKTHYGSPVGDGDAFLIEGNIFGRYVVSDRTTTIAKILPPVDPPNIIAIGLNYKAHVEEGFRDVPSNPVVFLKATTSVIADGDPIILPPAAPDEVDFEAELALIIGRTARNVPKDRAMEYVFAFTCANDVSARDCQLRIDKQWARAKSFDTFCPLGPAMVTVAEFTNYRMSVRSRLNGEIMQDGSTGDMIFDPATLVSYLSECFTLLPGTVILTGTPAGVGFARKPTVFLKDGDRIEVEIERVGKLSNPVVKSAEEIDEAAAAALAEQLLSGQ